MGGLKYQLKAIRRDKMCILTFLLPIVVGLAINLLSGVSLSSVAVTTFGALENDLSPEAVTWLESNGNVTVYADMEELTAAINAPATQLIGVLNSGDGLKTLRSGDELKMTATISDTLPKLYAQREIASLYLKTITPPANTNDVLKPLLIVITLVTAMFMGCTFNAMNIISEKEDGIVWINNILPMSKIQYVVQKMALGFIGGILSTAITAVICIRIEASQIVPLLLLIALSAFIAALMGIFIGRFSNGLMMGILYIKIVMILFLAPPILVYLLFPAGSNIHTLSYIFPSSATFYGLFDLLNGQTQNISVNLVVLLLHSVGWLSLYSILSKHQKKV